MTPAVSGKRMPLIVPEIFNDKTQMKISDMPQVASSVDKHKAQFL